MPSFGSKSKAILTQLDPGLRVILSKVVDIYDITLLEGLRTLATQKKYYEEGKSQTMNSKHLANSNGLSDAVDVAPYPVNWGTSGTVNQKAKAISRFYILAGMMFAFASENGINLRWGGDWDKDWDFIDQSFDDLVHFEIVR